MEVQRIAARLRSHDASARSDWFAYFAEDIERTMSKRLGQVSYQRRENDAGDMRQNAYLFLAKLAERLWGNDPMLCDETLDHYVRNTVCLDAKSYGYKRKKNNKPVPQFESYDEELHPCPVFDSGAAIIDGWDEVEACCESPFDKEVVLRMLLGESFQDDEDSSEPALDHAPFIGKKCVGPQTFKTVAAALSVTQYKVKKSYHAVISCIHGRLNDLDEVVTLPPVAVSVDARADAGYACPV
jgi:hypothetical protein